MQTSFAGSCVPPDARAWIRASGSSPVGSSPVGGFLGDVDGDADLGLGVGVGVSVEPDWQGDTHVFRGGRLSGTVAISDYDCRILSYAASRGTPVFPTPCRSGTMSAASSSA